MGKRILSLLFICSLLFYTACKGGQPKDGPGGGGGGNKPQGGGGGGGQKGAKAGQGAEDGDGPAPFAQQGQQPAQNGLFDPNNPNNVAFPGLPNPNFGIQDTVPRDGVVNPAAGAAGTPTAPDTSNAGIGGVGGHAGSDIQSTRPADGQRPPSVSGLESPTTASASPSPSPSPQPSASLLSPFNSLIRQGVDLITSPFGQQRRPSSRE